MTSPLIAAAWAGTLFFLLTQIYISTFFSLETAPLPAKLHTRDEQFFEHRAVGFGPAQLDVRMLKLAKAKDIFATDLNFATETWKQSRKFEEISSCRLTPEALYQKETFDSVPRLSKSIWGRGARWLQTHWLWHFSLDVRASNQMLGNSVQKWVNPSQNLCVRVSGRGRIQEQCSRFQIQACLQFSSSVSLSQLSRMNWVLWLWEWLRGRGRILVAFTPAISTRLRITHPGHSAPGADPNLQWSLCLISPFFLLSLNIEEWLDESGHYNSALVRFRITCQDQQCSRCRSRLSFALSFFSLYIHFLYIFKRRLVVSRLSNRYWTRTVWYHMRARRARVWYHNVQVQYLVYSIR